MRLGSKPRTPEGTAPFSGSPGSLSDCLKIQKTNDEKLNYDLIKLCGLLVLKPIWGSISGQKQICANSQPVALHLISSSFTCFLPFERDPTFAALNRHQFGPKTTKKTLLRGSWGSSTLRNGSDWQTSQRQWRLSFNQGKSLRYRKHYIQYKHFITCVCCVMYNCHSTRVILWQTTCWSMPRLFLRARIRLRSASEARLTALNAMSRADSAAAKSEKSKKKNKRNKRKTYQRCETHDQSQRFSKS